MIQNAEIISVLDSIRDCAAAPQGKHLDPSRSCDSSEIFYTLITDTMLPRQIVLQSPDTSTHLSVVAKNQRIARLLEVHPETLWKGPNTPRPGGDPEFSDALNAALNAIISGNDAMIESRPLPNMRAAQRPEARPAPDPSKPNPARVFCDHYTDLPRCCQDAETSIEIPEGAAISEDWFKTLLDGWSPVSNEAARTGQFFVSDGSNPMGVAVVQANNCAAIIVTTDAERFADLEKDVCTFVTEG